MADRSNVDEINARGIPREDRAGEIRIEEARYRVSQLKKTYKELVNNRRDSKILKIGLRKIIDDIYSYNSEFSIINEFEDEPVPAWPIPIDESRLILNIDGHNYYVDLGYYMETRSFFLHIAPQQGTAGRRVVHPGQFPFNMDITRQNIDELLDRISD